MPLQANKKLYMLLGISISVLALLLFLVVLPLQSRISFSKQENYDQRVRLESLEYRAQEQDLFQQSQSVIENDELRINKFLPKEQDTLEFITALEDVADQFGIGDQKFALADFKTNKKGVKTLEITLDFSTDYLTFINYLARLEALTYYIEITSINADLISTRTETLDGLIKENIQFHLTAKTHWQ